MKETNQQQVLKKCRKFHFNLSHQQEAAVYESGWLIKGKKKKVSPLFSMSGCCRGEENSKRTQGNVSVHTATRHIHRYTCRTATPLVYIMYVHLHTCIDKYIHTEAHTGFCSGKLFIQTSQSSSDRVNCRGIKDEAVETG